MTINRLAAILGNTVDTAAAPTTNSLPISALVANGKQPRRHFNKADLTALANSIKEQGILQPLLVRPIKDGYEIIAGERRWRAAQMVGLQEVPVLIRSLSDAEVQVASLLENIQRKDLQPMEEIDAKMQVIGMTLSLDHDGTLIALQAARSQPDGELGQQLTQLFQTFGGESWQSFASNKTAVFGWAPEIIAAMRKGLEFTKAKMIQAAPPEIRSKLLDLALQGASRTRLQTEISTFQAQTRTEAPHKQVAKILGNQRYMAKLPAAKSERINILISQLLKELSDE